MTIAASTGTYVPYEHVFPCQVLFADARLARAGGADRRGAARRRAVHAGAGCGRLRGRRARLARRRLQDGRGAVAAELDELRALTSRPFGLNLFYPAREPVDEPAVEAYALRMRDEAERYGVEPGEPRWSDDDWTAKLELAARERPAVLSFTFGCPEREIVESLRTTGCVVWCTVTSRSEAEQATAAGVDALVVQGAEAGGHQGSFHDHDDEPLPLLALLDDVARATEAPLIAAGGIASGGDVAAALAAGAVAAQIGSALLLAREAGPLPHTGTRLPATGRPG